MPDVNVNPSAIANRSESAAPSAKDGTPAPSKPPPLTTTSSQKGNKPAQVCTRVDVEPLYTALKAGIGEHWASYKDGVSRFILGHLSAAELASLTSPFLHTSDQLLHQHNQLILALTTNLAREPPEPGVAPWVSANDKPTSAAKPMTGDPGEHRLKHEVMQLPPRFRARIKATNDDPVGPLMSGFTSEAWSRRLPTASAVGGGVSTPLTAVPPSAGPASTGLNKDQEIKKRYQQSLVQESQDLPDKTAIAERVLPIAYEEGLMSGVAQAPTVSSLLGAALTTYVKETLGDWLSATRTNPPMSDPLAGAAAAASDATDHSLGIGAGGSVPGIYTASYKKRVNSEATQAARGKLKRNEAGLLPVEVQAQRKGNFGRGREGDARLAWELRAPRSWVGMVPWAGERLAVGNEFEDEEMEGVRTNGLTVNGHGHGHVPALNGVRKTSGGQMQVDGAPPLVNGDTIMCNHDRDEEAVALDEMDWGWEGAGDPMALDELLDDCLNV